MDPEWVEFALPKMMSTLSQTAEEFKNMQRVRTPTPFFLNQGFNHVVFRLIGNNHRQENSLFLCRNRLIIGKL